MQHYDSSYDETTKMRIQLLNTTVTFKVIIFYHFIPQKCFHNSVVLVHLTTEYLVKNLQIPLAMIVESC